jgi:hypothetical protein
MRFAALILTLVLLGGCAPFRPVPVDETDLLQRIDSRTDGDVTVKVAVTTVDEARRLFSSKLAKKKIQPVWIEVENRGESPVWFFPHSIDPDYFPPLEVAWRVHRTWSGKTNRAIDEYFYEQRMPPRVEGGDTESGFVFVGLDQGAKYVPLKVMETGDLVEMEFFVNVPDVRVDYAKVDFGSLYEEYTDLPDEEAVRGWIETLPCCARNLKGTNTGDPINFVLIGTDDAFVTGFLRAGWNVTAELTAGTKTKTATAAIFGKTYEHAPISPLYVYERSQDIGLQKARKSIHHRNHLRLWLAPVTFRGEPVRLGQISRDIGSKLTTKSKTLTTHKIDPDVDDARAMLLLDLVDARVVAGFGFVVGVGERTPDDPGLNLTNDPFFTDGDRLVLFLTETSTDWEDVRSLWAHE